MLDKLVMPTIKTIDEEILRIKQLFPKPVLNENLNKIHLAKLRNHLQAALNNGSISLQDITSDRYFILGTTEKNKVVSLSSTLSKEVAIETIKNLKNNPEVFLIQIEKPEVAFQSFIRREKGKEWEGGKISYYE